MKMYSDLMLCILLSCAVAFAACAKDGKDVVPIPVGSGGGGTQYSIGDMITLTAEGISFNMAYVPGGLTCPTGVDDNGDINFDDIQDVSPTATVHHAFWIAETEVPYELWYQVRSWAENASVDHDGDGSTGDDIYSFVNVGCEGNVANCGVPVTPDQEPVTSVNWRHAMAWCNALTEWYNATAGNPTKLDCMYYTDFFYSTLIRQVDDSDTISGSQDFPYVKADARGFRLPTTNEWEIAARYIQDTNNDGDITDAGEYYPGNFASGSTASHTDNVATSLVGVYYRNYTTPTTYTDVTSSAPVKSKNPNALGLYDMSGNLWEWCFDWYPGSEGSTRVARGGCWGYLAIGLAVGQVYFASPHTNSPTVGFRFARTR